MFEGWKGFRGFLRVGKYMIPLLASLIGIYILSESQNYIGAFWAFISGLWIINSWVQESNIRISEQLISALIIQIKIYHDNHKKWREEELEKTKS